MRILISCLFLLWFFPGSAQNQEQPAPITKPQIQENPETAVAQAPEKTDPAGQVEPAEVLENQHVDGEIPAIPEPELLKSLPPIVDYDIRALLDTSSHQIIASQTLAYTNHSPDLIGDLQFHLYPNADLNNQSANNRGRDEKPVSYYGYLHIRKLEIEGKDKTADMTYFQAPGAPPEDRTVMKVDLDQPLLPGETVRIKFEFVTQLVKGHSRSAHDSNGFYFVAQWFPKIGVWETVGMRQRQTAGWNCHAKHRKTEFYADFGNYQVALELPKDYEVGATGKKVRMEELENTRLHVFRQERVHDFAFCTGSRIIVSQRDFVPAEHVTTAEMEAVAQLHGIPLEQVRLQPLTMTLLLQPEHRDQEDRHFQALITAIKHYGLMYGPYPYETLTMVDPNRGAGSVGGMEYPTLVTLGTAIHNPEDDLRLETVILHEFGHQYWYGMVASNEFEESWLDEGFTSYSTHKIKDAFYGNKPDYRSIGSLRWYFGFDQSLPGLDTRRLDELYVPLNKIFGFNNPPARVLSRYSAITEGDQNPIATNAWEYHPSGYSANSYSKPALMLWQLENELGPEVMDRVLRSWFHRWQFRHPSGRDFIELVQEVSGRDMGWFFDELLYKGGSLDYLVAKVESKSYKTSRGYQLQDGQPIMQEGDGADHWYHSALVEKRGTINYPTTIQIVFSDGHEILEHWDGSGNWKLFEYSYPARLDRVVIDPKGLLVIDRNYTNNSRLATADTRGADRWYNHFLLRTQGLLQILSGGL